MASVIPKEVKKEVIDGYVAETWKVCLLTNSFTYVDGTHVLYTDLTNEVSGSGYTAGGETVAGKVANYADTVNCMVDATDTAWPASTFSARYAVVYNTVTLKIRCIIDLGADYAVTTGTFTIQWNVGGIVKIS